MRRKKGQRETFVTFARLYFEPTLFSSGTIPLDILKDLLASEIREIYMTERGDKKSGWVITDNSICKYNNYDFGLGKLGRISPKRVRAFDDTRFTEFKAEISRGYLDSCFVVDFSSSWIAFENKTGISVEQFCHAFAGICMKAENKLGFMILYPEVEKEAYAEAFKKLRIIQKVKIELVTPNPKMYDLIEDIKSKLLIEPGAAKATIDCEGTVKGLKQDSTIVKIAKNLPLDMPQYGSVEVKGREEEDGPIQTISSFEKALKTAVNLPKEKEEKWVVLMNLLFKRR